MASTSPDEAEELDLRAYLERERSTVEREATEIDLLIKQAATEAERHEARRVQAAQRLEGLERDDQTTAEALREANAQLLAQTRRAGMMQSQTEVLGGKQRVLQRLDDVIGVVLDQLDRNGSQAPAGAAAEAAVALADATPSGEVLAAQEEMRRDIARQMHDGPAQSIANIALQAQVVQRLFEREPAQAAAELEGLVIMVQRALDATKSFIFDVRPMVLDDLGLVPTLRRAAAERGRRSSVAVGFHSVGNDRRLPHDMESALFRMLDDAVVGYLERRPTDVTITLEWGELDLHSTVRARPTATEQPADKQARAAVETARRDRRLPAAMVKMIHEQEGLDAAGRGLPDQVWADIRQRADVSGIKVKLTDDGWQLEAIVSAT